MNHCCKNCVFAEFPRKPSGRIVGFCHYEIIWPPIPSCVQKTFNYRGICPKDGTDCRCFKPVQQYNGSVRVFEPDPKYYVQQDYWTRKYNLIHDTKGFIRTFKTRREARLAIPMIETTERKPS